tara:strand:+ start:514 stop:1026 length:513 start_codon:yes stop_codon:yes gene_type:complete
MSSDKGPDFPNTSGVFITCWTEDANNREHVLKTTAGGNSHVTLFYCGDASIPGANPREVAAKIIFELPRRAKIVGCHVNSFLNRKTGKTRHDILMDLDQETAEWIETLRKETLGDAYNADEIFMGKPHVTYAIDLPDLETLNATCKNLQKLITENPENGIPIVLNGITLD